MHSVRWNGSDIAPSKIVCVGRNYAAHIRELDNSIPELPVFFIKPNSAVTNIIYSSQSDIIHYEGEISLLIIAGEIAAVGFGLDLTKRELQSYLKSHGLPWERAKSFDRAAVFSDFVSFTGHPASLRMQLYINDELVQQGGYELMLHKPEQLLADAKAFLTFEDGDILMTGTPAGVGTVNCGDQYRAKIFDNDNILIDQVWTVE